MIKDIVKKFCTRACLTKLLHFLAFMALGSAQIMVIVFAIWLLYPYRTSEMVEFYPLQPTVKKGQMLQLKKTVRKYVNLPAHIVRQIDCADNSTVYLLDEIRNFPAGTTTTIDEIIIPERTTATDCHLEYTVTFQVNPLRKIVRNYSSQPFTVTN